MSSLTFKQGETVAIKTEIEELNTSIASAKIKIEDSSGNTIVAETDMEDIGNNQYRYFWVAASDNPTTWAASTAKTLDDEIVPTVANTYKYVAQNNGTSGETEPTWSTTVNGITVDKADIWVKETDYLIDKIITPTTSNTFQYKCTDAGTSGILEPTWNVGVGSITNDGPGVWTRNTVFQVDDVRTEVAAGGTYQYKVITGGKSGQTEPSWDTLVGHTTEDFADNWAASTPYILDDVITPTTPNGYQYKVTSAGTSSLSEPSWSVIVGETTTDTHDSWVYSTSYNLGNIVIPTTPNGYSYIVTSAGKSAVNEPSWTTTIGNTTIDKPEIWEAMKSYILNDRVTATTPDGVTQYKCTNAGQAGDTEPTWDTVIGHTTTDEPSDWTASTYVSSGTIRIPTTPNGYRYVVTNPGNTGNVEPSWNTVVGGITYDRYGIWEANTSYTTGDTRTATSPDGVRQYRCISSGTSGPAEPSWNVTLGENTTDNTVTWVTESEDRVEWTTQSADSVIWTAEDYSEVEWTCREGSNVEYITEVLSKVIWETENYDGVIWTAEAYTGINWKTEALVTIDGIYDVTITAMDQNGYKGIETFQIRIV